MREYINLILSILLTIVPLLISVAFLTLLERKVLGAMQRRRGPNVVGVAGLLQPFADGIKLLLKETVLPTSSNFIIFVIAPMLTLILSIIAWAVIPFSLSVVIADLHLGVLYILAISSLGVYGILMAGWSSNSKYAFLGALRSSAQMVSYEVSIGLIILIVIAITGSFNLTKIIVSQEYGINFIVVFPAALLFFISILAETNRPPFDLPEAEGELVAGYNVEYSAAGFAFFFIAEYLNIILMSVLYSILFLGGWLHLLIWLPQSLWLAIKAVLIMFIFIWVRASVPRYRYNQLMALGWKIFLPLSLAILLFFISLLIILELVPSVI